MILNEINNLINNIENEMFEFKIGQAFRDTGTVLTATGRLAKNLKVPLLAGGIYAYGQATGHDEAESGAKKEAAKMVGSEFMKRATPATLATGALAGAAGWHYLNRKTQPKEEKTTFPNYNINTQT